MDIYKIIGSGVGNVIDHLIENEPHYITYRRGNSWTFCHNAFKEYSKISYKELTDRDFDFLALNLAFYLASWGMYRGSSFLLNMDYKIHIPAVKKMMADCYKRLFEIENPFADYKTEDEYYNLLFGHDGIYLWLNNYYYQVHRHFIKEPNKDNASVESDTLLTKILLGVFGCVPAYDRFFKYGISLFGGQQWLSTNGNAIFRSSSSLKYLLGLPQLKDEFDAYYKDKKQDYTYMKLVDMYFFSLGDMASEAFPEKDPGRKNAVKLLKENIKSQYQIQD